MQQPEDAAEPLPEPPPESEQLPAQLEQGQLEQWLAEYGLEAAGTRLILAGIAFVAILLVIYAVRGVLLWRMAKWSEKTTTVWDGAAVAALRSTGFWFVLAVAAFGGSLFLVLPEPSERYRMVINTAMRSEE